MIKERFVKISGNVYYESELRSMSDAQLRSLIKECQKGIEEIDRKSDDYRSNNYNESDIAHYQEVLAKFESASVYLQSDIVLIDKILKSRTINNNINIELHNKNDDKNPLDWYEAFCQEAYKSLFKSKWKKIAKKTSDKVGFSLDINF